ncbi:MAG: hypothetical protein LBP59_17955 [Planctomycetaceae bacterium]|jgi:hypothetical protein|nr:hypothetical protein [Planctomycetaceae bacterium]
MGLYEKIEDDILDWLIEVAKQRGMQFSKQIVKIIFDNLDYNFFDFVSTVKLLHDLYDLPLQKNTDNNTENEEDKRIYFAQLDNYQELYCPKLNQWLENSDTLDENDKEITKLKIEISKRDRIISILQKLIHVACQEDEKSTNHQKEI